MKEIDEGKDRDTVLSILNILKGHKIMSIVLSTRTLGESLNDQGKTGKRSRERPSVTVVDSITFP